LIAGRLGPQLKIQVMSGCGLSGREWVGYHVRLSRRSGWI
jgi:hypothetical protein